jgi:hypothetical protein
LDHPELEESPVLRNASSSCSRENVKLTSVNCLQL